MYQGDPRQVISHILLLQALIIIIIIIMQVSMCLMKMVRPERHVKWWALKCIIGLMNTTMENQRRFVFFWSQVSPRGNLQRGGTGLSASTELQKNNKYPSVRLKSLKAPAHLRLGQIK